MARTKSSDGVNKSAKIREYLGQHPDAKPKEIVSALEEQGIKVVPNQVSAIKGKMKGASGGAGKGDGSFADALVAVHEAAGAVGGFGELKKIVDAIAKKNVPF